MLHLDGFSVEQAAFMFSAAAVQSGLIDEEERAYCLNQVLDILQLPAPQEAASLLPLSRLGEFLVDWAVEKGLCPDTEEARERFSVRLFGAVTPSPRAVREGFARLYAEQGPEPATRWLHQLGVSNEYIHSHRARHNVRFASQAGLQVLISIYQQERDPKATHNRPRSAVGYPRCPLCKENVGYAGRPDYPARQNLRLVPITLGQESWYLQYSPAPAFPQHCVALRGQHSPHLMVPASFDKMLDFVDLFPHWFIGANADLPVVGGFILSHAHLIGGSHVFPVEQAVRWFAFDPGEEGVSGEALRWPITTLRLQGKDRAALSRALSRLLARWRTHSDDSLGLVARTTVTHNALTPMVRKTQEGYVCHVALRNNYATEDWPLGLFHPQKQHHHIKRENIGLLEAMGLFVLPGRLKQELAAVERFLQGQGDLRWDNPHRDWAEQLAHQLPQGLDAKGLTQYVQQAVGQVCEEALQDAGIYKQNKQGEKRLKAFLQY